MRSVLGTLLAVVLSSAAVSQANAPTIGAPVAGLSGGVWADYNNDGYVDGYVYQGRYVAGAPAATDSSGATGALLRTVQIGASIRELPGAIWGDRDADRVADGYVYNGQYHAGIPPQLQNSLPTQPPKNSATAEASYIGISLEPIDRNLGRALGMQAGTGEIVRRVYNNLPAEQAGLRRGDVIVSVNGSPITAANAGSIIAKAPAGTPLTLGVYRGSERLVVAVTPIAKPSDTEFQKIVAAARVEPAKRPATSETPAQVAGLTLTTVTQSIADLLSLSADVSGAVISDVDPGSEAASEGLKKGDVIVAVGSEDISSAASAADLIKKAMDGPRRAALLYVRRGKDGNGYLGLRPPLTEEDIRQDWGPLADMAGHTWKSNSSTPFATTYTWIERGKSMRGVPVWQRPDFSVITTYTLLDDGRIEYSSGSSTSDKNHLQLQPDGVSYKTDQGYVTRWDHVGDSMLTETTSGPAYKSSSTLIDGAGVDAMRQAMRADYELQQAKIAQANAEAEAEWEAEEAEARAEQQQQSSGPNLYQILRGMADAAGEAADQSQAQLNATIAAANAQAAREREEQRQEEMERQRRYEQQQAEARAALARALAQADAVRAQQMEDAKSRGDVAAQQKIASNSAKSSQYAQQFGIENQVKEAMRENQAPANVVNTNTGSPPPTDTSGSISAGADVCIERTEAVRRLDLNRCGRGAVTTGTTGARRTGNSSTSRSSSNGYGGGSGSGTAGGSSGGGDVSTGGGRSGGGSSGRPQIIIYWTNSTTGRTVEVLNQPNASELARQQIESLGGGNWVKQIDSTEPGYGAAICTGDRPNVHFFVEHGYATEAEAVKVASERAKASKTGMTYFCEHGTWHVQ